MIISVKNLNGTADRMPKGTYYSWKQWWEAKKYKTFPYFCSTYGCSNNAEVGAHVQKVYEGNEWYIVPLCKSCNNKPSCEHFSVQGASLQAINS